MNQDDTNALHSLEASVLGAVFLDNGMLAQLPHLEPSDFVHPKYRSVFSAMRVLETKGLPIDPVTVEAEIRELASPTGGGVYPRMLVMPVDFATLGEIALHVPTADNALEYARRVRSASLARKIRLSFSEILEQRELDGGELLSMAWASLSKLDEDQPDSTRSIGDLVRKRFKQLEKIAADRASGASVMTGFPTGVHGLDERIGGWQPGIVSIVAARPGMGKSSLGLATARASSAAGFGVHVFSLEDTEDAYADRTISGQSDVPAESLRNASLNRGQTSAITQSFSELRGRKWLVDDRSGLTADEIVRSARRHSRANGTRVVIVDYVQLVAKQRGSKASRHEELTEHVTTLANAAKHDGIAYVVMSQLNRDLEKRQDKRPQLADLRESGSLEERAKCVVGMYRGSVYGDPVRGVDWDPSWGPGYDHEPTRDEFGRTAQLCVLKNSNGRTGIVFANWSGPTTVIR